MNYCDLLPEYELDAIEAEYIQTWNEYVAISRRRESLLQKLMESRARLGLCPKCGEKPLTVIQCYTDGYSNVFNDYYYHDKEYLKYCIGPRYFSKREEKQ